MSLSLSQPPTVPLSQSELSSEILAIVNNRRITEHSAMIWNIPSTQTIYSVVAAFQEACGEIVGVGAMHDMREDPTLKCIRASFATPYSLQIALNLSGTLWGGSKLLIRKYKGPNHGKTNSNLLLAQNGFNLNGINNLPSNLSNISIQDIQHQSSSSQQITNEQLKLNSLVNNGAINAGRGSNKTVAQQIFQHLDMQQLAYLMLVQQHITQNNQFKEQEEREKTEKELEEKRRKQMNEFDDEQTNKNLNRKRREKSRSRNRSRNRSSSSSRSRNRRHRYYHQRDRYYQRDRKKRKQRDDDHEDYDDYDKSRWRDRRRSRRDKRRSRRKYSSYSRSLSRSRSKSLSRY